MEPYVMAFSQPQSWKMTYVYYLGHLDLSSVIRTDTDDCWARIPPDFTASEQTGVVYASSSRCLLVHQGCASTSAQG